MKKAVYDYAAGAWTLEKEKLFVYDGWNLVEEIKREGGTETSRYFVWGKDLSGSLQGAGGIGGLVATVDGSSGSSLTHYFCYDGNGNVGQMVKADDGSIAAAYEYDPYGKVLKADGDYAGDNPFRFSTKYTDDETGLVYYGYRYYSSELGRWLSRDPLGERGGINHYSYVFNNSLTLLDPFGLYDFVASGTENLLGGISESRYLQQSGRELLNNPTAGEHGSYASFLGYFVTLGYISYWDAQREGANIARKIVSKNDPIDRGIGHSQGVGICLEGIRQAAETCKQNGNCKCNKTIRLALLAPKTSAAYIDRVHIEIARLQPGWNLLILIVYSPNDVWVPKLDVNFKLKMLGIPIPWTDKTIKIPYPELGVHFLPGDYHPTSYAMEHYILNPIVVPGSGHSYKFHTGEISVDEVPGQSKSLEAGLKTFFSYKINDTGDKK